MGLFSDSLFIGGLHLIAGVVIFKKLPPKVRKLARDHTLLTEGAVAVLTYGTSGGGVTAMGSAAVATVGAAGALHVANHPEDFVWLEDAWKQAKGSLEKFKEMLAEKNREYIKAQGGEYQVLEASAIGRR